MIKYYNISVFFPVYNEEEAVEKAARNALGVIPVFFYDYEIIIVDDGSTDKTGEIIARLVEENKNIRVISHAVNMGYGAALKSGFEEAKSDLIFYTDGDNQFDISEIKKFFPYLEEADIIIGYRESRQDPWQRLLFGKMYRLLIGFLFGLWVRDVDCAFKLIKKDVVKSIELKSDGALLSAELLIKAKKNGFKIKEVGVRHYPRRGGQSTGGNPLVILRAFYEIMKFWRELR